MVPLDLVKLAPLMERTSGDPEIAIGLIDGPIALDHPDLVRCRIREVEGEQRAACSRASSVACVHGTFVAGILCARRGSVAPAICPDCTLLVRPIFAESTSVNGSMPSASPDELAAAIVETVDAGARLLNMSVAPLHLSTQGGRVLEQALDWAAHRGVITVAAAGNQRTLGSSAITRHHWVIPVAGCDLAGRPLAESNFGVSIGTRGVSAPGETITSLGTDGKPCSLRGTSAATPFVTGTIALLWSAFPDAGAAELKLAVTGCGRRPRRTLVPPVLDAWAAYQAVASAHDRTDGCATPAGPWTTQADS
jgi:subtilisin family serine protease